MINQNAPILILNPDALFNFIQNKVELNKHLLKRDLAFFGIKDYINNSRTLKKIHLRYMVTIFHHND